MLAALTRRAAFGRCVRAVLARGARQHEERRRLGRDRNKVFIDINGNREAESVLAAIANVQQVCGLARPGELPQGVVVVVKSREVYDLLSSNPELL